VLTPENTEWQEMEESKIYGRHGSLESQVTPMAGRKSVPSAIAIILSSKCRFPKNSDSSWDFGKAQRTATLLRSATLMLRLLGMAQQLARSGKLSKANLTSGRKQWALEKLLFTYYKKIHLPNRTKFPTMHHPFQTHPKTMRKVANKCMRAGRCLARCCGGAGSCRCRAGGTPIAVAKSGAEGGGSQPCLRNRLGWKTSACGRPLRGPLRNGALDTRARSDAST